MNCSIVIASGTMDDVPIPPSKVADGYDLLTAIEAATKEAGHA